MNTFWNILWIFPFFGWVVAIFYGVFGLIMCATVVGLPIGLGLLQYSKFLFWPHGNVMVSKSDLEVITEKSRPVWWKIFACIVQILYFPIGLICAVLGAIYGFICLISILGIPEGLVMMKSIGTLFNPVNKVVIPSALSEEIKRVKSLRRYSPSYQANEEMPAGGGANDQRLISPVSRQKTIATDNAGGLFCNKCGCSLPNESLFCPKCGSPVVQLIEENVIDQQTSNLPELPENNSNDTKKAVDIGNIPPLPDTDMSVKVSEEEMTSSDYSEYSDEGEIKKKRLIAFCGIGIALIAVAIAIWAISFRSDEENYYYVYADSTELFQSVNEENGIDPIVGLSYGTPVKCSDKQYGNAQWVKVSVKEAGNTLYGYINSEVLIGKDDFEKIDQAGFDDYNIRESVSSTKYRQAILKALRSKDQWWHLDKIDKGDGTFELNGRTLLVRGVSPSERCFGFVLSNDSANWDRELFVYSFTDQGNPEFLYSENLRNSDGKLRDVSYKNGKYVTIYTNIDPNSWRVEPIYEVHEYPLEEVVSEVNNDNAHNRMRGYIGGKYEIEMNFIEHPDKTLYGEYSYTKYNAPIRIQGSFEIGLDGKKKITLDESQNGEIIGHFNGIYEGNVFSGMWSSSDGEREMPFRVERR